MIFWRVKPLDKILETAEKKGLKRQLGPIQLLHQHPKSIIANYVIAPKLERALSRNRNCTTPQRSAGHFVHWQVLLTAVEFDDRAVFLA